MPGADPGLVAVQHEHRIHRPAARRGDAERYQRLHRDRAVPRVAERGLVKRPGRPDHHRRRERHQGPLPAREPERWKQRQQHRQVTEWNEEDQRKNQSAAQVGNPVRIRPGARSVTCRRFAARPAVEHIGAVACPLDCLDQCLHRNRCWRGNRGPLGREIHGRRDAGDRVELLFNPRGAGCARHPADREVNLSGRG